MTGLERILATLEGRPVDRRPVSLTASLYGAKLADAPVPEIYQDAESYLRGQRRVRELLSPDVLFSPFALALEAAAFGAEIRYFDHQPPNLTRPAAATAAEAIALPLPDVDSEPHLVYLREATAGLAREHGHEVAIAAVCASPIDLPALLLGIGGWIETLLLDEPAARRILERCTRHFVRFAGALLEGGASLLVIPTGFANPLIVPADLAERLGVATLRTALTELGGPVLLHSAGTRLLPALPLLAGLPHVAGFVVGGGEDLVEARRLVGPSPVLVGNLEGSALGDLDVETLEQQCWEVLQAVEGDPRVVLGTAAADIALDAPLENVGALGRVAARFAGRRGGSTGAPRTPPTCLACSIFRNELESLREGGDLSLGVRYFDSMLHLHPTRLQQALTGALAKRSAEGQRTLLVWGDCHPHMLEHDVPGEVARVTGLNCIEILLEKETYRRLRAGGAFFLLPEWAHRWREAFHVALGTDREIARALLREDCTRFVYLDTGLAPVPTTVLEEISAYFELPWEVRPVDLDHLRTALRDALDRLEEA